MSSDEFLTGLTGRWVNAPRTRKKAAKPVRPVRQRNLTGPDGSEDYRRGARPHMERKAADPSDPSGAGTKADIVHEPGTDIYHLAATVRIRVGYVARDPGDPLCGEPEPMQPCPPALFPVEREVTCWLCAVIAERDHITVGDAA